MNDLNVPTMRAGIIKHGAYHGTFVRRQDH